jgi:hypothetical protein
MHCIVEEKMKQFEYLKINLIESKSKLIEITDLHEKERIRKSKEILRYIKNILF